MPRKILVAALALVGVLAVAGVAYAVNVYSLDRASTTGRGGVGTSSKPVPKKVVFGFSTNTDTGQRAEVIRYYDIGLQRLRSYSKNVRSCTWAQVNQKSLAAVQRDCRRAAAGSGNINNFFGSSSDKSQKTPCNLKLRIYNVRGSYTYFGRSGSFRRAGGLALRLDRAAPADCVTDPATAIPAEFRKTRIGGFESVNLRFEVGTNLRHPIPGFDNSVNVVLANVARKLGTARVAGRRRTVGLLSSIGCGRGKRRLIRVKFTDETGASANVSRRIRC